MTIITALFMAAPLWAERGVHRYGLVQVPHQAGKPAVRPVQRTSTEANGAKIAGGTGEYNASESAVRDLTDFSTVHPETHTY